MEDSKAEILGTALNEFFDELAPVLKKGTETNVSALIEKLKMDLTPLAHEDRPLRIVGKTEVTENRQKSELDLKDESAGTAKAGQVKIAMSMGFTRNLGNFNNAKFDAYSETYAEDTKEGFDKAMDVLDGRLTPEIERRQAQIAEYLGKKPETKG